MMVVFTFVPRYLARLTRIKTPQWMKGMGNDEYEEICHDYVQLRNAAKDLLSHPQDKEAMERLSGLIK